MNVELHINDVVQLVNSNDVKHQASLYLRPEDPMSVPIDSGSVTTDDLLLRIEVPKVIGRKRKRNPVSSSGPSQEDSNVPSIMQPDSEKDRPMPSGAELLLQNMQDNADRTKIDVIGHVNRTHRFRSMFARQRGSLPL